MTHNPSIMEREAFDTPEILSQQFLQQKKVLSALKKRFEVRCPAIVLTLGRGSSDHAATFAKYAFETELGLVTSSVAPSVITLYQSKLKIQNPLVIAISQSGQSPDIVESLRYFRAKKAITIALVNDENSPLAHAAEFVLPMLAGPEIAVAATKTFIASLSSIIHLVAVLKGNKKLLKALGALPQILLRIINKPFINLDEFISGKNVFAIGRGFGFAIAQETALKFKEVANIHAEAFSSAEFMHGPLSLIQNESSVILFAQGDATLKSVIKIAKKLQQLNTNLLCVGLQKSQVKKHDKTIFLKTPKSMHPICDNIIYIQIIYAMLANFSLSRGLDPDVPPYLTKVTKTW